MTKIKNILLLTVLITTLASCGHNSKEATESVDNKDTTFVAPESEIHRIVRETVRYWDSVSPGNNIDIIAFGSLTPQKATDTLQWIVVYPLICYHPASRYTGELWDTTLSYCFTIIDGKLVCMALNKFMVNRNKSKMEFVDPESFPQYKKCEYDFCYDPLIWYFCLKNDSFVLRHIGYYLPENIRKGNFKDTVPKFPFPIINE